MPIVALRLACLPSPERGVFVICLTAYPAGRDASTWALDRPREAITRLSGAGLDWQAFTADAMRYLHRATGSDCWCLSLNDPDTDLPAGAVSANPVIASHAARRAELLAREGWVTSYAPPW